MFGHRHQLSGHLLPCPGLAEAGEVANELVPTLDHDREHDYDVFWLIVPLGVIEPEIALPAATPLDIEKSKNAVP